MGKNTFDVDKIKYILTKQKGFLNKKLSFGIKDLTGDRFISSDRFALEDFYEYFANNDEPVTLGFSDVFFREEFVITGMAEDGISLKYFSLNSFTGKTGNKAGNSSIISTPKLFLTAALENQNQEDSSNLIKTGLTLLPNISSELMDQLTEESIWRPAGVQRFENGIVFNTYTNGNVTVSVESYKADIVESYVQSAAHNERSLVKK